MMHHSDLVNALGNIANLPGFITAWTGGIGQDIVPTIIFLFIASLAITLTPGLEMAVIFQSTFAHKRSWTRGAALVLGHNTYEACCMLFLVFIYKIGILNVFVDTSPNGIQD